MNAPLRWEDQLVAALPPKDRAEVLRYELTRECMRALARLDPAGQPAREAKLEIIHRLERATCA